jgi:hypothetical protein
MRGVVASVVLLLAACGGLETPDLSTGAVAGRVVAAAPGGRVYVLGRPDLHAALAQDGSFFVDGVPVGAIEVVAFDGASRAGRLPALVRGADVTWIGPAAAGEGANPSSTPAPGASDPANGADGSGLPLAGAIVARATSAGQPVLDARFTVERTDRIAVAPGPGGDAVLTPLPPGAFTLLVTAPGHAEARVAVEVRAGEDATVDVVLAP